MITVVTSICEYYDNLRPPKSPTVAGRQVRWVCFADEFMPQVPPWEIQPVPQYFDPAINSRIPKILTHLFFDSEYTIWIDGGRRLLVDPNLTINRFLADADIAFYRHPARSCVYKEAEICLRENIGHGPSIQAQVEAYRAEGYPANAGLWAGGIILRRNTPGVQKFNETWWREFMRFPSRRDQLSLPYSARRSGILIRPITEGSYFKNSLFEFNFHNAWTHRSDNEKYQEIQSEAQVRRERLDELCRNDAGKK